MPDFPKFIYVNSSLVKQFNETYPEIVKYVSKSLSVADTIIVVTEVDKPYVDNKGVLYVGWDSFKYVLGGISEFVRVVNDTGDVKAAFSALAIILGGEINESVSEGTRKL